MHKRRFIKALACAASLLMGDNALASDWSVEANVATLETTYIPAQLQFQITIAAGSCNAGDWLHWNIRGSDEAAQIANVQAVLATLMTAKATGGKVRLYGNNNGCTIDFIHLI